MPPARARNTRVVSCCAAWYDTEATHVKRLLRRCYAAHFHLHNGQTAVRAWEIDRAAQTQITALTLGLFVAAEVALTTALAAGAAVMRRGRRRVVCRLQASQPLEPGSAVHAETSMRTTLCWFASAHGEGRQDCLRQHRSSPSRDGFAAENGVLGAASGRAECGSCLARITHQVPSKEHRSTCCDL